ncbi:unnamed protein product [Brassicogethes aeneus]|uniref:Telomeric repeat-binding factor 2-interacting protein 1 n=1 Tax=Brassicogethes aeneus TaxID=1431903 RepID=A0A9P0FMV9_BRAAE|nr:unnamed protein product [Brassicogethes aeneus]
MARPYSHEEANEIIQYIIENEAYFRVKGNALWNELEESGRLNRTFSSMKEHFKKTLMYQLHYPRFNLDDKTIAKFKQGFQEGTLAPSKKKQKKKPVEPEDDLGDF